MGKAHKSILAEASVKRVLRAGATESIDLKKRKRKAAGVTASAAEKAVKLAEAMLKQLASAVHDKLRTANKKTVTPELLAECLKDACYSSKMQHTALAATAKGRRDIAVATAIEAFKKGIVLKRGAYRISKDARAALSDITSVYLAELGRIAGSFADAGKRGTIKASDVSKAAMSCMRN